jgi:hypothetical protein
MAYGNSSRFFPLVPKWKPISQIAFSSDNLTLQSYYKLQAKKYDENCEYSDEWLKNWTI